MNKDSYYQNLIVTYLRGELSSKEEGELFDWLNSSPENYSKFQSVVKETELQVAVSDETEKAWERFQAIRIKKSFRNQKNQIFLFPRWAKIAAVLAIVSLAGIWGSQYFLNNKRTAVAELIVPYGEKKQIDLGDGTKVWLNAGTTLHYPEKFSGKTREVELDGEGYFEVSKDQNHPFIIHTSEVEIKVLGTSFNVSSYQNDDRSCLALYSGVVQLSTNDNKQQVVLKPGEKAILEKSSKTLVVTPDAGNHASWREDILVFDNLSLVEISRLLERRFNVKIQIKKEKIRNIRYSGKFTSDEGLSEVLDIIRETSPVKFNYQTNKEEIIIE
jgi:ferric-dicitrate binding protein FerR (iron transport regulator)